jgi:hypothetical protein
MRYRRFSRLAWLVLRVSSALALALAPWHVTFDGAPGIAAATADAGGGRGGGGSGGGGGNGGGNGGGGNSGSQGGSNSGSAGGSNSSNGSNGSGNGQGQGNNSASEATGSHVNTATGDKVEVTGNSITVVHPNGMKEEIDNGRFEMTDAQGRTIIERQATQEDLSRLQGL